MSLCALLEASRSQAVRPLDFYILIKGRDRGVKLKRLITGLVSGWIQE
jgi:hypothetical protein